MSVISRFLSTRICETAEWTAECLTHSADTLNHGAEESGGVYKPLAYRSLLLLYDLAILQALEKDT